MVAWKELWEYLITDSSKKKSTTKTLNTRKATTKKKLGYFVVLFILINSILGSSLFYLPSLGVETSGAASLIAWAAIFLIAVIIMFYIGELITMHPTSGGTYEFCKRAYGRFGSFMAGWTIWIAGNLGMALNIIAAAEYFIPDDPWTGFPWRRVLFTLIWIVVLNYMAFRGIDAGATMLVTFGAIAAIVVAAMILPSFIDFPALFGGDVTTPFKFSFLEPFFRFDGIANVFYIFLSLFVISEAFFGFEAISYMANEVKKPKNLHKILITATVISGIIMMLYVFSSLGVVSYHDYVTDARPWAVQALNAAGQGWQTFVVFGMYLTIIGAAAAWPITGSRLLHAMAKDKLFMGHFAKHHHKYNSPYRAVIFQAIMVFLFCLMVIWGYNVLWADPYRTGYLMYVLLGLITLILVLLTVPILRKKEKKQPRPFKAPFARAGPIALVIFIALLIVNWINIEGALALSIIQLASSFIIIGLPFYFLVEMFYNPTSIVKVNEWLSYFVLLGEKLFFPFSIRKKILKGLRGLRGETVLEYGCSMGTLSKKIAQRIGPTGRLYATDFALHKVRIADRRTKKIDHVFVHHEPSLYDFNVKLSRKVGNVVSVGMLSYMQNPIKVLKAIASKTKKGADVVFVDYDKFFWFIPNVKWIENDKQLAKTFSRAGFKVTVNRKNGLLWQYIIVTGTKK